MHHRSTVRRLLGTAVLLGALLTASSCAAGNAEGGPADTPHEPSASATHNGHTGQFSPPPAQPLRAGERFVNLTMPKPYTPAAPNGGTDEYRCFLVDPKLTAPAFLTGSQFLPQNADIVHHAIFFRVDAADVASARKVDAEAPGEGWTCFGDAGIEGNADWVAHWAPGANETLLRPDIGYPMTPGSQLVMQVHYNLLGMQSRAAADQSGIRMRLSGRSDLRPLRTALVPAPVELACAPNEQGTLCDRGAAVADVARRFGGESRAQVEELNGYCNKGRPAAAGTTQSCDHTMPNDMTVYATAGHMHLLGRAISVEVNPGTAGARKILDVPNYNFDEQAVRPLAQPVAVKKGDTLRVTCTHDVTMRQQLPQLKPLPPRYVVWGEGTSDEMCLGILAVSPTT